MLPVFQLIDFSVHAMPALYATRQCAAWMICWSGTYNRCGTRQAEPEHL
jgi:hypothetical protein